MSDAEEPTSAPTQPVAPKTSPSRSKWHPRTHPRWWSVVAVAFVLGVIAVATIPQAKMSSSSSLRSSSKVTATSLPSFQINIQSQWSVTDTDNVTVSGSTIPGAQLVFFGNGSGSSYGSSLAATADASGQFSAKLSGLTIGQNTYEVSASKSGYSESTATVVVTRTVSESAYKASAQSIPYAKLDKDPASLAGTVVTYSAQVFQYDSRTGTSNMLVYLTQDSYGLWTDNALLDVDPSQTGNICQNTIVQFWGTVKGAYSYQTAIGGNNTVPEIQVQYINATSAGC